MLRQSHPTSQNTTLTLEYLTYLLDIGIKSQWENKDLILRFQTLLFISNCIILFFVRDIVPEDPDAQGRSPEDLGLSVPETTLSTLFTALGSAKKIPSLLLSPMLILNLQLMMVSSSIPLPSLNLTQSLLGLFLDRPKSPQAPRGLFFGAYNYFFGENRGSVAARGAVLVLGLLTGIGWGGIQAIADVDGVCFYCSAS